LQLQDVLKEAREQVGAIQKDYDALTIQYDELLKSHDANHEALQQRAEAAETALQEARAVLARAHDAGQLPANAMVLELDAPTAAMLSETCEHLDAATGHYPQLADFAGVTPGVLLVSMFRRYVKERRTEWFFPLAILPPERIAEIES
jgi:chromosome segregation ATPase